jgi:hypothetical protein
MVGVKNLKLVVQYFTCFSSSTTYVPPPPMCFYLVVVVGLACTNEPESYVGGSIATGRVSQTEQVEG